MADRDDIISKRIVIGVSIFCFVGVMFLISKYWLAIIIVLAILWFILYRKFFGTRYENRALLIGIIGSIVIVILAIWLRPEQKSDSPDDFTPDFVLIATENVPARVEIPVGYRLCWPNEVNGQTESWVHWNGSTKIRFFAPKQGVGVIKIPFSLTRID